MATQPTNLPVQSESLLDLKFHAGKIDEFVTSDVPPSAGLCNCRGFGKQFIRVTAGADISIRFMFDE